MTSPSKDSPVLSLPQASSGAPEDPIRAMLSTLIHEPLEREVARFIGAQRFERSPERRDVRNGYRRRQFTTRVGQLALRIPRDRAGRFQPALFARSQRSEQALVLALTEMYIQGVSTRKVSTIVETLCGTSVSASEVSALTKRLDGELEVWRTRPLSAKAYPYLVVDAHVERVRREGQVRSTAVLWVIGVGADGYREHLGVWLNPTETGLGWRRVFELLLQRGLSGVQYVVSDEHPGLVDAIRRFFPDAVHQRCQGHYLRNTLDHVSSDARRDEVKEGLRDVWNAPSRPLAETRLQALLAQWHTTLPKLAAWMESSIAETLTVFALRDSVAQHRLRSTNGIEHDHMAVRRRTSVIRVFPNEASFIRLASALAMERNEKWLSKRYVAALENILTPETLMPAA
ncbi:MAG: IS256 family transposase [Steroidobacteraceae bacterium]